MLKGITNEALDVRQMALTRMKRLLRKNKVADFNSCICVLSDIDSYIYVVSVFYCSNFVRNAWFRMNSG